MHQYGLYSAHYFSTPGISLNALLKMTKIALELFSDIIIYLIIQIVLHYEMCIVSKRYTKASNPQCSDYDSSKPNSWIIYLDANNLYGLAKKFLPVGEFQWSKPTTGSKPKAG